MVLARNGMGAHPTAMPMDARVPSTPIVLSWRRYEGMKGLEVDG